MTKYTLPISFALALVICSIVQAAPIILFDEPDGEQQQTGYSRYFGGCDLFISIPRFFSSCGDKDKDKHKEKEKEKQPDFWDYTNTGNSTHVPKLKGTPKDPLIDVSLGAQGDDASKGGGPG